MPRVYPNSCQYLQICRDGFCNKPCAKKYCTYHNQIVKKHCGVSPPPCSNCNLRGTWSTTGICHKCTRVNKTDAKETSIIE